MLPMSHLVQENHLTQNEFNLIFRNIENIARVNAAFSGVILILLFYFLLCSCSNNNYY